MVSLSRRERRHALRAALAIAAVASGLAACAALVGVQDVPVPIDASEDSAAGEASTDAEASAADKSEERDGSPDRGASADAGDARAVDALREGVGAEVVVDAASEDGSAQSGSEGGGADVAAESNASDAMAVGDAASEGPTSASFAVPIPGPDGGSPRGNDGGVLMGELIDDIDSEFTPGYILPRSGRMGSWFTYDDGTSGGVVPAQASPPSTVVSAITGWDGNTNNLAAHATGSGLASYAGIGFTLNVSSGGSSTYDGTPYQGFSFWGRIGGTSGSTAVRFSVPDPNTVAQGGVCTDDAGGTAGCSDYFGKAFTFTPTWQQFVVYYDQLGQQGFGTPKGLPGVDAAHMYSCEFQPVAGAAFDVWIDDVYFIDK